MDETVRLPGQYAVTLGMEPGFTAKGIEVEVPAAEVADICLPTPEACTRTDDAHHRELVELPRTLSQRQPRTVPGRCLHRHALPVESGGNVVAHLCLHCDEQLS